MKLPAFLLHFLSGLEVAGVAGHMKHCRELYAPRVCACFVSFGLSPKHTGAEVHLAGDLHFPPGAEDWASSSVRIEQGEILRR